jgi:NTE family protein
VNTLGAEWRSDVQIGRTTRIFTEFYQPLFASRYLFVVPSAQYERRSVGVFQENERIASYDIHSSHVALELGSQLTKYAEVRLGLRGGPSKITLDTGPAFLDSNSRTRQVAITAQGVVDQLDSASFPRSGYAGSFHVSSYQTGLGSDSSYTKGDIDAAFVASSGDHTFSVALKAGGNLGAEALPRADLFQWGGLLQQSGYRTGALLGESLTFGRFVYYHRLKRMPILEGMYGGFSLEAGRVGKPLIPSGPQGTLKSASLFLGVDSPVGPLYLGYGRAADGNSSYYFFLGRP